MARVWMNFALPDRIRVSERNMDCVGDRGRGQSCHSGLNSLHVSSLIQPRGLIGGNPAVLRACVSTLGNDSAGLGIGFQRSFTA
jgi:hypothetical protein